MYSTNGSKQTFRLSPDKYFKKNAEKPFLNELTLALTGLIASLLVITTKIVCNNWDSLTNLIFERQLITYTITTDDSQEMFTYAWKNVARYSNIWLPALCGLLTSYFTWIMVYLDSNVPGEQPPSPLSPKKYQDRSGHVFHLNYIFALIVGLTVFFYMHYKEISISY